MTEIVEASSGAGTTPAPGTDAAATTATRRRKAGGGLEGMLLPELKQLAGTLGIKGTGALRKGQLIEAIKAAQTGGSSGATRAKASQPTLDEGAAEAPAAKAKADAPAKREGGSRRTRAAAEKDSGQNGAAAEPAAAASAPAATSAPRGSVPAAASAPPPADRRLISGLGRVPGGGHRAPVGRAARGAGVLTGEGIGAS